MEDKYNKLSHREKFLVLVVLMSLIFYISDVLMTEKNITHLQNNIDTLYGKKILINEMKTKLNFLDNKIKKYPVLFEKKIIEIENVKAELQKKNENVESFIVSSDESNLAFENLFYAIDNMNIVQLVHINSSKIGDGGLLYKHNFKLIVNDEDTNIAHFIKTFSNLKYPFFVENFSYNVLSEENVKLELNFFLINHESTLMKFMDNL